MARRRTRPFKGNIFNKILLTSSLTIVATVIVLIVMITNYYSEVIIQREMTVNARILDQVSDYYLDKEADVSSIVRDLYGRGEMLDDITYALQHRYDEYLQYRLDKFSAGMMNPPRNIDTYFFGYFNQDDDVNAVLLRSVDYPDIQYLFIYQFGRWYSSIGVSRVGEQSSVQPKKIELGELKNTLVRKIPINNPATLEKMGELLIFYSTEGLDRIVRKDQTEIKSSFFLLDEQNRVLYEANDGIPNELLHSIPYQSGLTEVKWKGDIYYLDSIVLNENQTFLSITPRKELFRLTFARGTMWVLIAIATIMAISITYTFMRNYSARINIIDATIKEVQNGNLAIRIPEQNKNDELSTIATSFNTMLDDLNEYIERYYMVSIKQQEAELKALQSQINPHFLFNTLEVIRMSAVVEGSRTSSKMIYHLSRLLRYSLESKEMVSLYVEIENIQQYLNLVQLQNPNKLEVVIDIPEKIGRTPIQRLILQPIVENYIVHGFRKDRKDNYLEISAQQVGDDIEITVRDNGIGILEEKLQSILTHIHDKEGVDMKSIGLKNVHQRLQLKHGASYGLEIESEVNVGTNVKVTIPSGVVEDA